MSRLNIPAELMKSGLLRTNLHGVRTVLQREFGFKHFPISLDDKVKAQQDNDGNTQFPYGWLVPSDAQLDRDKIPLTPARRFGMRTGLFGATRNTSRVGHIFPVRLGIEIHVQTADANQAMHYAETFLMLSGAQNALSFDVKYGNQFSLNTRLEIPDSVTVPFGDTGDTTKPGAIDLTVQAIVHTYAGFFIDKASVYAEDPVIGVAQYKDMDSGAGEIDGFTEELDPWIPPEYKNERLP